MRSRAPSPRPVSSGLVLLALSLPAMAQQQDAGFDAHGFDSAAHDGDVRDPLVVQRPGAFSQGDFFFGFIGEYAHAPLVAVSEAEVSGQVVEEAILGSVVAMNLSTGVAVHDHLRFDLKAPVYLLTSDERTDQLLGPAPGDLRGTAMLLLIRPQHVEGAGGLGVAVVGHVDAPIGDSTRFLGQSGVAGGGGVAATYEFSRATLSADVGTQFNPNLRLGNLNGSDNLVASFGAGVLASDSVGLTAEIVAKPPFQPPERLTFPAEALGHLKYRDESSGAWFTLGGAVGLTSGPGVAAFRAFLGGGVGRIEPPRPADLDAIGSFEIRDRCPLEREVENGWKDDDGCPDELAALSIQVRYQQMPWEADARVTGPEGARDVKIGPEGLSIDALPGSTWKVEAKSGNCLAGSGKITTEEGGTALVLDLQQRLDASVVIEVVTPDGTPVPAAVARWTGELPCLPVDDQIGDETGFVRHAIGVGAHHLAVTAPGYAVHEETVGFQKGQEVVLRVVLAPSLVQVTKERIEILEKVQFETAKAVILPQSFGLLDEVAAIIKAHPELGRVEVGGHTDSRGSDTYNLGLSQERANAVRTYLSERGGVVADRLLSVGYGETRPLDTNKTPQGREKNRRVEFALIDQVEPEDEAAP